MVSGINSMNSSTNSMLSGAMQKQPPPPPRQDVFQISDSDGNGLVSDTELDAVVLAIAETTGNTIDAASALSSFDANGDSALNGEELLNLLSEKGFAAPAGPNGGENAPPPPPPPMELALASYGQNSGEDLIDQLISLLQGDESEQAQSSSINIIT